jgi:hypothetical protein
MKVYRKPATLSLTLTISEEAYKCSLHKVVTDILKYSCTFYYKVLKNESEGDVGTSHSIFF